MGSGIRAESEKVGDRILYDRAASSSEKEKSGDEGARTPDPRLAKPVLSQLSYIPKL